MQLLLITDGKPGHRSQLAGLAAALPEAEATWHDAAAHYEGPRPDVVAGAGRRTHWPLWRTTRRTGAKSVVLMRPSLPRRCYDLCVVPEHDGVSGPNVVTTVGALSDVRPLGGPRAGGLLMVGGPSKHHGWDETGLLLQVDRLTADGGWTATTSRRTPAATTAALTALLDGRAEFVPCERTPPGWVRERLAAAEFAAVTEDSVSMLSEAVTAGCRTAAIAVPRRNAGRVARAADAMLAGGYACRPNELATFRPARRLAEADRVAALIRERLAA